MQSAESIETLAIISRAEAISLGLRYYFTGVPCLKGHISERRIDHTCAECQRGFRRKADKKASDNAKKNGTPPRKKNENSDARKLSRAKWLERNPQYKFVRGIGANAARSRKFREDNPHKDRIYKAARRARTNTSAMSEFDRFVVEEAYAMAKRRKSITGYDWHVDHMTPLAKGGFHCWDNIQVIPAALNVRKRDQMMYTKPMEWINAL